MAVSVPKKVRGLILLAAALPPCDRGTAHVRVGAHALRAPASGRDSLGVRLIITKRRDR